MMPMSSSMPKTNAQTPVRYSHVAHFVGMSLLRDPNLARSKKATASKSASMPQLSQNSELEDFPSQSLSSKPSLSVERVDQLRCQINWLKAERRAENEQFKKLQHSLSDSVRAENLVHERANQQRKKRDQHEQQLLDLKDDVQTVKAESRRQLSKTWPDGSDVGRPSSANNYQAATLTADAAGVDAACR